MNINVLHFAYLVHGIRGAWKCNQRLKLTQVYLYIFIIAAAWVSGVTLVVLGPALTSQIVKRDFICFKQRCSGTKLCAHVAYRSSLWYTKALDTFAIILKYLAHSSFDRQSAQHFEDYVLGSDPWSEHASQLYSNYLGHFSVERCAGHGYSYIQTTYSNCQHACATGSGSVTIRTYQQFARC